MSHRRDKAPTDYDDLKRPSGRSQDPETHRCPDEFECYRSRHDRSYRHKENGRDVNNKRSGGYMRGWDDGNTHGRYYLRKEHEEHTHGNGKHLEDEIERHRHHRKCDDGPRHSEVSRTSSSRANNIVRVCPCDNDNDNDRRHQSHVSGGRSGYDRYDGKDDRHGHRPDVVERGRPRERSSTHSSRDESSSSGSESSSHRGTKGFRSRSSDSQAGGRRASERSPHSSSKRKHRHRSRSRSRSGSTSSSEEREKKRKKKDKRKKDKSQKKDKDKDKEERRSILTGKKIKLKVKKGREDHERDANRQELLQFLNAAYE